MHLSRGWRLARLAASLLCTWSFAAAAQDASQSGLRSTELRFSANGDLAGWQVEGLARGATELIDADAALLRLQLSLAGEDVTDDVAWRELPRSGEVLGAFVGTLADPGVEIRRSYRRAANAAAIRHELRINAIEGSLPANFRATLVVPPALQRHAPGAGSLGSVLYGYSRTFAASPEQSGELQLVTEPLTTAAGALAVRHVAVALTPVSGGDAAMTADPEAGLTHAIDGLQSPATFSHALAAVPLRGALLVDGNERSFLYPALWWPLRVVARGIEWTLELLTAVVRNPGVAVVLFAILLRAALAPLGVWAIRQQRAFTATQEAMKPKIAEIQRSYQGVEKSERILATYKEHGFSPFSGLKGSTALFIQLPILIAFFAVTTESALFRDAPFLWASDLSLPDRLFGLPFSIPGLGADFNLLPIALGIVSVAAALIQSRQSAGASPRSGLFLGLIFVVFFYSCAAALVLYWLIVNAVQIVEGLYVSKASAATKPIAATTPTTP